MPRKMPIPMEIGSVTDKMLTITWSDEHRSVYSWVSLRINCPCARCKGEGKYQPPKLTEKDISPAIRAMNIQRVGAYALRFVWSDGHDTGIYPFPLLRNELCECDECRGRGATQK